MLKLACQEQLLPGDDLLAKFDFARRAGFDGIELRAKGDGHFAGRLPELRAAARAGVVMRTVCPDTDHFIGDFDADLRRDAVAQLRSQLSVIAELGGEGVLTPASWGMFSLRLPPFAPPRSTEDDRKVLLDALCELAVHARARGRLARAGGAQPLRGLHAQPARAGRRPGRRGARADRHDLGAGVRRLLPPQHRGGRPAEGDRRGRASDQPRARRRLEPAAARHRPPGLRRRLRRAARRSSTTAGTRWSAGCAATPRTRCRPPPPSCASSTR